MGSGPGTRDIYLYTLGIVGVTLVGSMWYFCVATSRYNCGPLRSSKPDHLPPLRKYFWMFFLIRCSSEKKSCLYGIWNLWWELEKKRIINLRFKSYRDEQLKISFIYTERGIIGLHEWTGMRKRDWSIDWSECAHPSARGASLSPIFNKQPFRLALEVLSSVLLLSSSVPHPGSSSRFSM